jgi:methionine-rich copper-binding protein CopC
MRALIVAAALFALQIAILVAVPTQQVAPHAELKEKYGVSDITLRFASAGLMLDFRYRVVDPDKAQYLANRDLTTYLYHHKTGSTLIVPSPPKTGTLRQTSERMKQGRVYAAFFANPGRIVGSGDKVDIVIGDFKAEDLVVQ